MIVTNSQFDTENAKLGKKPIYVFAISGLSAVYTTANLAANGVTGAPAQSLAWLKTPRGATQSIDVLNGSSSIGELECEIIDQAGALRTLVGTQTLEGRTVTLSIGYPYMAYANFVALHTYVLYKVNPSKDYTAWIFRSRDLQTTAKRTIWEHPGNGLALDDSNPWVLQGTPAEIVQAVYLWGLQAALTSVDRTGLAALDSAAEGIYRAVRPFRFIMTEAFEAKQFLEREVYRVAGMYPVISNTGKIAAHSFRPPAAGPSALFTFTANNMIVLPEIDRMPIVNEIVWKIDGGKTKIVFAEATSISTYGRGSQWVVESKGLRTELGAQWWCQEIASRMFARFAGTPDGMKGGAPVYRIEAFLLTLPVWVGDYVAVTHPLTPDLTTGAKGITARLMEVIDREPDFAAGRMRYRLLDTGLTGLGAAHCWSSSARDFLIGTSEVY